MMKLLAQHPTEKRAADLLPQRTSKSEKPKFFQRLASMPKPKPTIYKVPLTELKRVVKLLEKGGKLVTVTVPASGGFIVSAIDPVAAPVEQDEWDMHLKGLVANGKA